MYAAKADGKGKVSVFESGMHDKAVRRLELKGDLRRALDTGDQLYVEYQPIVELATGEITGAEALVRWQHPVHGDIRPDRFIGLAEEDSTVVELGRYVLEQACADLAHWRTLVGGDRRLSVAVNVSPRQLQHAGLVAEVEDILSRTGVPAERLVIEITESVVMLDAESSVRRLQDMRDLGIRLAIDDFGTGYSSLSYLERLPVHIIKIDRSFVEGICSGGQRASVVLAVLRLAQSLDLATVAEGVETIGQFRRLLGADCPYGQGFLFSEPLPASKLEAMLVSGTSFANPQPLTA